jgi:hypothetical protein
MRRDILDDDELAREGGRAARADAHADGDAFERLVVKPGRLGQRFFRYIFSLSSNTMLHRIAGYSCSVPEPERKTLDSGLPPASISST